MTATYRTLDPGPLVNIIIEQTQNGKAVNLNEDKNTETKIQGERQSEGKRKGEGRDGTF